MVFWIFSIYNIQIHSLPFFILLWAADFCDIKGPLVIQLPVGFGQWEAPTGDQRQDEGVWGICSLAPVFAWLRFDNRPLFSIKVHNSFWAAVSCSHSSNFLLVLLVDFFLSASLSLVVLGSCCCYSWELHQSFLISLNFDNTLVKLSWIIPF